MTDKLCICLNEPMQFDRYEKVKYIGIDITNRRYGDVTLKRCKRCDRYWLHYFIEYEAFTGSGRHFMGAIAPETARTLSPDAAVEYLNSLEWHLYSGSYFGGKKGRSTGKVQVE